MIKYLSDLIEEPEYLESLCFKVFETPVTLSQKYDGTNVGKDEYGQLYGRNKMILETETKYQNTDLTCVKEIDVAKLKVAFAEQVGVETSIIKKFVVYGELMCNPRLYDYETNGVSKTFQLFGIMMETDLELQDEIHGKVKAAGYTVLKKTGKKLLTEEVQNANGQAVEELDQQTVDDNGMIGEVKSPFMQICFNRTFQNLA